MKKHKLTALDPIRTFYIAEELLPKIFKEANGDTKKLKKGLEKALNVASKVSDKDLLLYDLDNWHQRYDNYINSKWELKEISLADCGSWPGMGGLPHAFTEGSIVDTAKHIQTLIENKNKITWKTAKVLYIEEMIKFAELITESVPLIVLEGGVIRNTKLESKKVKPNKKCKYDIDDGNHRAIALTLLGKKKVKALVGKREYKSNLIY